jgi:hypothetical protein
MRVRRACGSVQELHELLTSRSWFREWVSCSTAVKMDSFHGAITIVLINHIIPKRARIRSMSPHVNARGTTATSR